MLVIPLHVLLSFLQMAWGSAFWFVSAHLGLAVDIIQKVRLFFWVVKVICALPNLAKTIRESLQKASSRIATVSTGFKKQLVALYGRKKRTLVEYTPFLGFDGTYNDANEGSSVRKFLHRTYSIFVTYPYFFFRNHGSSVVKVFSIVFPIVHMSTWAATTMYMGLKADEAVKHQTTLSKIAVVPLGSWKYNFAMLTVEIFCAVLGLYQFYRGWQKSRLAEARQAIESREAIEVRDDTNAPACNFEFFVSEPRPITPAFVPNVIIEDKGLQNIEPSALANDKPAVEIPPLFAANKSVFEMPSSLADDKPAFKIPAVSWRLSFNDLMPDMTSTESEKGVKIFSFRGDLESKGLQNLIDVAKAARESNV